MSRPDVVATCETGKRIIDALLMATSEEVHEKLTRLDKGQPGSVLRSLRLTRDRLTGERGSEIMLKGPTAEKLTVRVNELVGNVGLVGASVFDISEEDREHANRAPIALSVPLRDELVRASSTLDRLLGSAVELRNWREVREAELASLVETSDPAANAIRHQRRVEIAGEIALVNQRETELLGEVYEVSNDVRRGLEERTQLLSSLIRLGLGPIPAPRSTRGPHIESSVPVLDQDLISELIEILSEPQPIRPIQLPDEVRRFIKSVFETIHWKVLLEGLLPANPPLPPIPKFLWDYYTKIVSARTSGVVIDAQDSLLALTLSVPDLARWVLWNTKSQWPFQSTFLQPRIGPTVNKLGSVGSYAVAAKAAWDSGRSEWDRQQGRKNRGEVEYSDTQIVVHSAVDAAAKFGVSLAIVEGVGGALVGVPVAGPLLSVGWKVFVGPAVADFVNKNITAPIMDNKYVEAGIDVMYGSARDVVEFGRDATGKVVHGAGEVLSNAGDSLKKTGDSLKKVGDGLLGWSGVFG